MAVASLQRAAHRGDGILMILTLMAAMPIVIGGLYAVSYPAVYLEDCMFIPLFWDFFAVITEYVLLNWAWKRGLERCYSTMMVWAAMMCVEGSAGSVAVNECSDVRAERAFIVLAVWTPLFCNYGAVLIAVAYHSYSDEERAARIRAILTTNDQQLVLTVPPPPTLPTQASVAVAA